jgi:hypothetical protein
VILQHLLRRTLLRCLTIDLLIFGVAANKKDVMILHHFVELGGTRLAPDSCVVALFGNSDIAMPLSIDCTESFKPFPLDLPLWDDLYKACDTAANLKPVPAAAANSFTSSSMIIIPQALAVPITTSVSKDAADIGVVVAAAMAHHEVIAQSDMAADSFMIHCQYVLSFCKAVAPGKVSPTLCSPSDDRHVVDWCIALHTKFIMPGASTQTNGGPGGPSNQMMLQVSATMSNMDVTMAHQHELIVTQSEKKTPGFAKLGSRTQKLILFASSPEADSAATAPVSAYAVFLGIKSMVAPGSISRMN